MVALGQIHPPTTFTIVDGRHATSPQQLKERRAALMDELQHDAVRRAWALVRMP